MSTVITLDSGNASQRAALLAQDAWIVACLCAAWCDVCGQYRHEFGQLAARHGNLLFIWIDVEDQADLVGDIDIDNFPTLLIQREDNVAFFGTMQPSIAQLDRLLRSVTALLPDGSPSHRDPGNAAFQKYNIRHRLRDLA